MRILDYHVHTDFSPDSSMKHYEAVKAAIKAGITDICFTEHMDLGHHMESFNRVPKFGKMQESICELRKEFPIINIRYGLEAGYMKETAEETAKVIAGHVLPHPSVIRRYYELGGRIVTIGSDAHTPERVGEHVSETIDIVRECGVKEIVMFKKRKPEFIIIE